MCIKLAVKWQHLSWKEKRVNVVMEMVETGNKPIALVIINTLSSDMLVFDDPL